MYRVKLPQTWIDAFKNPECFYCGKKLTTDEYEDEELPHERMCQKCYEKEAAEQDY